VHRQPQVRERVVDPIDAVQTFTDRDRRIDDRKPPQPRRDRPESLRIRPGGETRDDEAEEPERDGAPSTSS